MADDGGDGLGAVVTLFAFCNVFGADSAFAQIDVAFVFVNTHYDDDLIAADADQFLDGPNASAGEF